MPDTNNPYVGPRVFTIHEAKRFFGREDEASDLRSLVVTERLTLFYAQSGAGKSSLINTRLIPQLRETRFAVLPVGRVSGDLPESVAGVDNIFIFNLLRSLDQSDASPGPFSRLSLSDFLARLVSEDGVHYAFDENLIPQGMSDDLQVQRYVLIIDQFEEIITAHPEHWSEREDFFRQLDQAMRDDPALWVVLALREDNLAALEPYASLLPGKMRARYYMQCLSTAAALEAIQKPAAMANRRFAPEAAQILVDNLRQIKGGQALGQFIEPVQLQVVCFQLWENLRNRPADRITVQDVQEVGDVDRALTAFYENALERALAHSTCSERQIRDWFGIHMITPSGTRGLAHRDQHQTEGLANDIVDRLTDAHIIRAENRGGEVWHELTHDRLIEPIIEANLKWQLSYHNPAATAYQMWLNANREPQKLLTGTALAEARTFAQNHPNELTPAEETFLADSQRQAETERARATQVARRTQITIITAIVIALMMSGLALWGFNQANRAKSQEAEAMAALATATRAQGEAVFALSTAQIAQQAAESSAATAEFNAQLAATREAQAEAAHRLAQNEARAAETARQTAEARRQEVEQALQRVASAEELAALEQSEAAIQRNLADSRRLALAALDNIAVDPELGLLLALHAFNTAPTTEAENALHEAVRASHIHQSIETGSPHYTLAYRPDGTQIASAGKNGIITIWDAATGAQMHTLPGHSGEILGIEYSPDQQFLASASKDNSVLIWDGTTYELLHRLTGHTATVQAIAFNPDGSKLASAGWDGRVMTWDPASGQNLQTFPAQEAEISGITFNPDGNYIATADIAEQVVIWDADSGAPVRQLSGHLAPVAAVAFAPADELLVSAGMDRQIKIWNPESGTEQGTLYGHTGPVTNLALSHNGQYLASAGDDGRIKLWDLTTRQQVAEFLGHKSGVFDVAFSPDDRYLASVSDDKSLKIWNVSSDQELLTVPNAHTGDIYSIGFSPDNQQLISAGRDSTVKIWETMTGTMSFSVTVADAGRLYGAEFTDDDGTRFATAGGDGRVRLWQLGDSNPSPQVLTGHRGVINGLAVWLGGDTPLIATASADDTARLWDANTGEALMIFAGDIGELLDVDIAPDGQQIATGSADNIVTVWDVTSGEAVLSLTGYTNQVIDVEFSPDGSQLATVSLDHTARLWDIETGQELAIFSGQANNLSGLSFSPDGTRLAIASGDRTTKLWDIESGREVLMLAGHATPVLDVDFSSDGKYLATAGENGEIRVYVLDIDELLALAQSRLTRDLTVAECEKFLEQDNCLSVR